jgi:phospholipid transport system substrate-binding protein
VTDYARFLLLATLAAAAPQALAQPFAGNEIVAGTGAELATTIATRRDELENDREAIAMVVDTLILPRFDMRRGSRAILAEHWDTASAADRDRFVTAFYEYLVATYGDLLLYFKPETLRVLPFDGDAAHSPARVHTVITLNDGTEVDVDFVMIGAARDWRVVDIEAEGVSYVRTYRSQFRVDIAADGLGSVIEWLEQKAAPVPAPGTR